MEISDAPGAYALRLQPGDDLRGALESRARSLPISAAGIVSVVGSLTAARIRMAGAESLRSLEGPLEILTLSGTVGAGGAHLHMMVADSEGHCVGGHVARGCIVHTTVELVLLLLPGLRFERRLDSTTGYPELAIEGAEDGTRTPPDV
ncbi:MAG: PPC domain-containing DNA-binding protein [Nannocystaceae bacterium]|nr:DNA-binding protein [bacterium]